MNYTKYGFRHIQFNEKISTLTEKVNYLIAHKNCEKIDFPLTLTSMQALCKYIYCKTHEFSKTNNLQSLNTCQKKFLQTWCSNDYRGYVLHCKLINLYEIPIKTTTICSFFEHLVLNYTIKITKARYYPDKKSVKSILYQNEYFLWCLWYYKHKKIIDANMLFLPFLMSESQIYYCPTAHVCTSTTPVWNMAVQPQ